MNTSASVNRIAKELLGSPRLGETITRELNDYTAALIAQNHGKMELAGTGTFVSFSGIPFILTAAHVWVRKLKSADRILIPLRENTRERFSIEPHYVVPFGPPCPTEWNEWGPDIVLLRLPPENVGGVIALGRSFFNLSIKKERLIGGVIETRFLMGAPWLRGQFTETSAYPEIQGMLVLQRGGPFQPLCAPSLVGPSFDYIDLEIDTEQPEVAHHFGGVSGGGLWKVFLYEGPESKIESFRVLVGVAFWQEPSDSGLVVRCHGPQSIGVLLHHFLAGS